MTSDETIPKWLLLKLKVVNLNETEYKSTLKLLFFVIFFQIYGQSLRTKQVIEMKTSTVRYSYFQSSFQFCVGRGFRITLYISELNKSFHDHASVTFYSDVTVEQGFNIQREETTISRTSFFFKLNNNGFKIELAMTSVSVQDLTATSTSYLFSKSIQI